MSGIYQRIALIALILALTRSTAFCPGSAPVPLSTLTEKADAIVVAQVVDGLVSTDRFAVKLDVIRVLKGTIQPRTVVRIDTLAASVGPQRTGPVEKDIGMFFLRASAGGAWTLLPPISGYLQEFRSTFILLPRNITPVNLPPGVSASALDKVIAEATAAVQGPFTTTSAPIDLAAEYRRNPSPAMKALFAQLRSHPNARLRVAGLQAGLADGHERSVAQLGQLTINPATPRRLRVASAVALARVHTHDTLPYLASLLNDPDPELRAMAVGGLAKFANNVAIGGHHPQPGEWKYRTDETMRNSAMDERLIRENSALVSFWSAWWAQHRAELERAAP